MSINVLDVVSLVEYGFCVIPTCSPSHKGHSETHTSKCKTPGKAPVLPKWQETKPPTKEQVLGFYKQNNDFNWSVRLGNGIIAIDLDGQVGINYFNENTTEQERDTLCFTTPNGGMRYIYKCEKKMKKAQLVLGSNHNGIDFLGERSLSVFPPSIGTNGKEYEWIKSYKDCDMLPIPISVMKMWEDALKGKSLSCIDSTAVEIRSGKISKVSEGARNDLMARELGKVVRSMGRIDFQVVFNVAKSINTDLCEPPLSDEVLKTMVMSFYKNDEAVRKEKERVSQDADMESPTIAAVHFINNMESKGYILKHHKNREMWYVSNNKEAGWKCVDNDWLLARIKKFLDEFAIELNKKNFRAEVLECIRHDCNLDETNNANRLELGVNGDINMVKWVNTDREEVNTLCVNNGVLNLEEDRQLAKWNPARFSHSYKLNLDWELPKEYEVQFWEECMKSWLPDDASRMFLQEYIGYMLVPRVDMRAFVFLTGSGSNGKSLFIDAISNLFQGNTVIVDPDSISNSAFATSYLLDKLLFLCPDADDMYINKTGVIKQLTGGDKIRAEFKYGASFDFKPVGKLLISTNKIPGTSDASFGYADRVHIVTFDQKFTRDIRFKRQLDNFSQSNAGKVAMLAWAIEGFRRYYITNKGKFTSAEAMVESKEEFTTNSDNVKEFLDGALVSTGSKSDRIQVPALYEAYRQWCFDGGVKSCSRKTFSAKATDYGYISTASKVEDSKTGTRKSVRCYCEYTLNVFYEYHTEIKENYKMSSKYVG